MNTTYGTTSTLTQSTIQRLYAYRYAVFVQRLGWELPAQNGLEIDQFDRPDTLHVIAQTANGDICGCARLLPTSRPYLLSEVFPQLMNGLPLPDSDEIWELSRFSATDLTGTVASQSWLCRDVMTAAIACAYEGGAKRLVAVTSKGIERILTRLGLNWHPVGPAVNVGGYSIFAFFVELDEKTLRALDLYNDMSEMVV
jgi:N-acyl-L-homoserine lactone synthetase